MAALSDIIKRVSAGNQAAKESLASGGTREQAREAGQKAAGAKAEVLQGAMQEAMRQLEKAQQPAQTTAPGMQRTASGDTDESDESSMIKDRKEKKEQESQKGIIPVYYYEPGQYDPGLLSGMSGFQGVNDLTDGTDLTVGTEARQAAENGKEYISHDFDALRDIGAMIPFVGPVLSAAGSIGNELTSHYEYSPNATSRPAEIVENNEYLADPTAITVPSAYDQRNMFSNDEAFRQRQENLSTPFYSTLFEILTGGTGGALSNLMSGKAAKVAIYADELAKMAVEDAVKSADNVAGGLLKSPENKQAMKELTQSYIDAFPTEVQDWIYSSMPYATTAGKLAGVKQIDELLPALEETSNAVKNKAIMGEVLGQMFPRLGRPLVTETLRDVDGTDVDGTGGDGTGGDGTGGMPLRPASQMAEFYEWSLGTEAGRKFMTDHPEFYDTNLGYETVEDYLNGSGSGYGRLFGTQDRDVWATLLGLDGGPGIESWRKRYGSNGVDLAADDSLDQLMDYLFGANAVNVRNVSDSRLQTGNMSEDALANAQIWRALADMYGFGPSSLGLAQAGYDRYDWDPSDLAYYMTIANMQNGGLGDITLDEINAIKGAAGEEQLFGYLDDEEGGFNERGDNKRQYSLNQLANLNITPWTEGDAPVYDMYMIDALTQAYNESHPDKKIGTK